MKFKSKIGMALVLTGVITISCGCSLIDNSDNSTNNNTNNGTSIGGSGTISGSIDNSDHSGNGATQNATDDLDSSEATKQTLTEAQSAIDDQNYEGAITTLETALKKSPTNKDLIAKYINAVKLRVNELTSKSDYDTALAVLQSAKNQLKNNDEINKLYEEQSG